MPQCQSTGSCDGGSPPPLTGVGNDACAAVAAAGRQGGRTHADTASDMESGSGAVRSAARALEGGGEKALPTPDTLCPSASETQGNGATRVKAKGKRRPSGAAAPGTGWNGRRISRGADADGDATGKKNPTSELNHRNSGRSSSSSDDDDDDGEEEDAELERIRRSIIVLRRPSVSTGSFDEQSGELSPAASSPSAPARLEEEEEGEEEEDGEQNGGGGTAPTGNSSPAEKGETAPPPQGRGRVAAGNMKNGGANGEEGEVAAAAGERGRRQCSASSASSPSSASPTAAVHAGGGRPAWRIWLETGIVLVLLRYCDYPTFSRLLRVSRLVRAAATSDAVWRPILCDRFNLEPVLNAHHVASGYYRFFLDSILTTAAIQGHYTFESQSFQQQQQQHLGSSLHSTTTHDDGGGNDADIFNIASVILCISSATFGQTNHSIGRAQMMVRYSSESMEMLQGSCRFSPHRGCFAICCNTFGSPTRGPIFTVAITQANKRWANECPRHFERLARQLRLIMTPVLLEGVSAGSQVTERDVIAVSRDC